MDEDYECPECGKHFGSAKTFQTHVDHEHSGELEMDAGSPMDLDTRRIRQRVQENLNRSFALGLIIGLLIASTGFSGYIYWNSLDHRTTVPVTVVTCDNCTWDRFKTATDRIFKTNYKEVDYQSERGQELIRKYNAKYIPMFIFDKKVEKAENFYRVESILVEFEDAYVLPDRSPRAAQRLSNGTSLVQ
ncbi:MAG: hypothetical protein ABEJ91_02170 [Candidatus Nanohaloarchaea archaeon]